ncbi:MAG: hypothetical protein ABR992_20490 [Solirubrobacteraceae bacterium]|jgi:hypothetical protein
MGGKTPVAPPEASGKKTPPGAIPADPIGHEPLSWHFNEIEFEGSWGWAKVSPADVPQLHNQLLDYERESLYALKQKQRARVIPLSDVCDEAQTQIKKLKRDDSDLWELRLGVKKWRVWGTIRGSIFYAWWWDPEHTVCRVLPQGQQRA